MGVIQSSINNLLGTMAVGAKLSTKAEQVAADRMEQHEIEKLTKKVDTLSKSAGGAVNDYAQALKDVQAGKEGPLGAKTETAAELATETMDAYTAATKELYYKNPTDATKKIVKDAIEKKGTLGVYEEQRQHIRDGLPNKKANYSDRPGDDREYKIKNADRVLRIKQEEKRNGKNFRGGKK